MTQVDFYIVGNGGIDAALLFASRLAQKAWARGHGVRLVARDDTERQQLRDTLWQFDPESFLPHCDDSEKCIAHAVQTGTDAAAAHSQFDVLINLGREVESGFSRYHRVAEIVCQDSDWLQASRDRYRFYRDRGHPLNRHEVSA